MTLPYVKSSETSKAAARNAEPRAGTTRALVLAALRCSPHGLTDEQMQITLNMNPSTQRPRRVELVNASLVQDSGSRQPTYSGQAAVVWVAVE